MNTNEQRKTKKIRQRRSQRDYKVGEVGEISRKLRELAAKYDLFIRSLHDHGADSVTLKAEDTLQRAFLAIENHLQSAWGAMAQLPAKNPKSEAAELAAEIQQKYGRQIGEPKPSDPSQEKKSKKAN